MATSSSDGGSGGERRGRPIEAPDPEGLDLVIIDGKVTTYRDYRQGE